MNEGRLTDIIYLCSGIYPAILISFFVETMPKLSVK